MSHPVIELVAVVVAVLETWVGLGVLNSMLGPIYAPISCASLLAQRTGVPHDSPLEGQSPWDFALITPGKARRC